MKVCLDIGKHVRAAGLFIVFQGVGLSGAVDLAKIVITRVGLGRGAGLHKVRDRDGGQQSDDGDHNHYFDQCKPGLFDSVCLHTITVPGRCGPAADRLSINAISSTYCPLRPQLRSSKHSAKRNPEKEQARGETSGLL